MAHHCWRFSSVLALTGDCQAGGALMPLLFFLLLSGGNPDAFFAHVANLAYRFLGADLERRVTFLGEFKFVAVALATLIVMARMPRFIRDLDRELSGEKL